MKPQDNNTQALTVKAGDYEMSVTAAALDTIAQTKEYSADITSSIDRLNTIFINMARGIPSTLTAEQTIEILSELQFIRDNITAVAAIDILRDGEPINAPCPEVTSKVSCADY